MTGEWALSEVHSDLQPFTLVGDPQSIGSAIIRWIEVGLSTRVVRGRKMRTRGGLFDEFAAAMQFPLYFGENWDAFDECVADLELPAGRGHLVVITEPDQVLADADATQLSVLAGSLRSAAADWAQPIEQGAWWDRPAVPFHVVLAGTRAEVESAARLWAAAGLPTAPLDDQKSGG
ncbi:barstar family protein [Homoserinibacter sp. GY 40078]|nr:barstar family protein [Homoserinibacter sp. GY 40078]TXK17709.1 barstar family protein [Homoserinibacter sp. GY 40078]